MRVCGCIAFMCVHASDKILVYVGKVGKKSRLNMVGRETAGTRLGGNHTIFCVWWEVITSFQKLLKTAGNSFVTVTANFVCGPGPLGFYTHR